ncbi:MAG: hypothetical protein KA155_02970 [Alphaproteobacteria bacterium]|jgi:hypothetical protein|nr:hypothetical protein [Alphaproteobacteria bacterium]
MRFLMFCAVFLLPLTAHARPVSWPGGWMVMLMNDTASNSAQINYTVTPKYALGVQHEYFREEKFNMDAATFDVLLKRWNNADSQANLYFKSGAGVAYGSDDTDPAAFAGLEIDWEDRRFFTLYENRFLYAGDQDKFIKHKARLGVAPYEGDYGDLHTWIMLQADYDAGADDTFSLTPLVRLFKGTTLVEAGYNLDGGILFNLTKQF